MFVIVARSPSALSAPPQFAISAETIYNKTKDIELKTNYIIIVGIKTVLVFVQLH